MHKKLTSKLASWQWCVEICINEPFNGRGTKLSSSYCSILQINTHLSPVFCACSSFAWSSSTVGFWTEPRTPGTLCWCPVWSLSARRFHSCRCPLFSQEVDEISCRRCLARGGCCCLRPWNWVNNNSLTISGYFWKLADKLWSYFCFVILLWILLVFNVCWISREFV